MNYGCGVQLIVVTQCDPPPEDTARRMCVVRVTPPEETKQTDDEVMAEAYGIKYVKRNRCVHAPPPDPAPQPSLPPQQHEELRLWPCLLLRRVPRVPAW